MAERLLDFRTPQGLVHAEGVIAWEIVATALASCDDARKLVLKATEVVIDNQSEMTEELGEFIRYIGKTISTNLQEQTNG